MRDIDWQAVQSALVKEARDLEEQMHQVSTEENRHAFLSAILVARLLARSLQYGLNAPRARRNAQAIHDRFG